MLDRNRRIKPSPERFQDINDDIFDVVFTVEERIFDVVIEGNRIDNTRTILMNFFLCRTGVSWSISLSSCPCY